MKKFLNIVMVVILGLNASFGCASQYSGQEALQVLEGSQNFDQDSLLGAEESGVGLVSFPIFKDAGVPVSAKPGDKGYMFYLINKTSVSINGFVVKNTINGPRKDAFILQPGQSVILYGYRIINYEKSHENRARKRIEKRKRIDSVKDLQDPAFEQAIEGEFLDVGAQESNADRAARAAYNAFLQKDASVDSVVQSVINSNLEARKNIDQAALVYQTVINTAGITEEQKKKAWQELAFQMGKYPSIAKVIAEAVPNNLAQVQDVADASFSTVRSGFQFIEEVDKVKKEGLSAESIVGLSTAGVSVAGGIATIGAKIAAIPAVAAAGQSAGGAASAALAACIGPQAVACAIVGAAVAVTAGTIVGTFLAPNCFDAIYIEYKGQLYERKIVNPCANNFVEIHESERSSGKWMPHLELRSVNLFLQHQRHEPQYFINTYYPDTVRHFKGDLIPPFGKDPLQKALNAKNLMRTERGQEKLEVIKQKEERQETRADIKDERKEAVAKKDIIANENDSAFNDFLITVDNQTSSVFLKNTFKNKLEKYAEILKQDPQLINRATSDGSTLLMRAAFRGHDEIVKLLLKNGADKSLRNNAGKTALQLASDRKKPLLPRYVTIVNMLK